jgi:hypothetical protein
MHEAYASVHKGYTGIRRGTYTQGQVYTVVYTRVTQIHASVYTRVTQIYASIYTRVTQVYIH